MRYEDVERVWTALHAPRSSGQFNSVDLKRLLVELESLRDQKSTLESSNQALMAARDTNAAIIADLRTRLFALQEANKKRLEEWAKAAAKDGKNFIHVYHDQDYFPLMLSVGGPLVITSTMYEPDKIETIGEAGPPTFEKLP